jgi:uncharacterized protein (TIGR02246 family)
MMKIRLILAFVGLAISFVEPGLAFRSFSGDFIAIEEVRALGTKYEEAFDQDDAVTLASLFAEDAVVVTPDGMVLGRKAIEEMYASEFQKLRPVNNVIEVDQLKASSNEVWEVGQWWSTVQSDKGPIEARGYYSAICVREGNAWKIRMSICNVTGSIALTPSATR